MTIDMHSHWKPAELADAMRARSEMPRIVPGEDGNEVLETQHGLQPLVFDEIDRRLGSMDRFGIDRAMLSMQPGFGWMERLAVAQSLPLVRLYNDSVAALCRQHGDRFVAVAALPLCDLAAAGAEFERAMGLPGMIGVNLPGDGFLTYARAQAFRPLFEIAERHRALVFIHRATVPGLSSPRIDKDIDNFIERDSTLEMQSTLSSIMITLCLTDLLDAYPDVTVLTHNLGGNLPFEMERLDHRSASRDPDAELPSVRIRRSAVFVDCNSFGPRAIERAVEVYGAGRIVFGTDGSDFGSQWSLDAVAEMRIADSDRQAIRHDNAAAMLAPFAAVRDAAE